MTAKWRRKAEIYRRYARSAEATGFVCDWSENAAEEMYSFESTGKSTPARDNGYAIGKGWLDVQIASWIDDVLHWPPLVRWDEIDEDLRGQVKRGAMAAARRRPA